MAGFFKNLKDNIMGNHQTDIDEDVYYDNDEGNSGFEDIPDTDNNDFIEFTEDASVESFASPIQEPETEPARITVVLFKPTAYNGILSDMALVLKNQNVVLVNLEDTTKEMSRRIIDFISGVAYAIEGKINKIAMNTYIVTPKDVDVTGDALVSELADIAANNDSGTVEIPQ